MTHPVIRDLSARYTTKKYDASKRISAEDIEVIKEALRLSASSINSQPWKFVILETDEAKERFHNTFANMHQFNQPHAKEASHTLLLAHNPRYNQDDYRETMKAEVSTGRVSEDQYDARFAAYGFAEMNTDENGVNENWTKSQVYLALGNIMHVLARLGIHSTPMEGIDAELVTKEFSKELDGHVCHVALAMGYCNEEEDYNHNKPKARLPMEKVVEVV